MYNSQSELFYVLHSSVEYWGRAWADYCYISYIASSASDVSALLVCMALHLQISRRAVQCRAHVDMNVTKQHYSQPWSVVSDSHWRVGKLPGSYSSTFSVGWIRLYHVSAHSPISHCLRRYDRRIHVQTSACSCLSRTWARRSNF